MEEDKAGQRYVGCYHQSAGMFILTVAGLADKSSLNMTQQYAEVHIVREVLCLRAEFSVVLRA